MQIIIKQVPDNFNLFLFGDVHTGSVLSYNKGWEAFVNMVTSRYDGLPIENNFCLDHGDCIEAITIDDSRFFSATTKEVSILQQAQEAIRMRGAIRKNLVCILKGNHEHAVHRFGDISKHICEQLKVPYGTYSAVVNYVDANGNSLFKHYATHGRKTLSSTADDPVRQRANMELQLKRALKNKFGDTLLNSMGHAHRLLKVIPRHLLYLTTDRKYDIQQEYTSPRKKAGYIEPNHKWYACTGAFYRLFADTYKNDAPTDSYSERAGYDPTELGVIIVKIRDREIVDMIEHPL